MSAPETTSETALPDYAPASDEAMEFLVQFEAETPDGVAQSEVEDRERAEAAAADKLAKEGHLLRIWRTSPDSGRTAVLGLYSATSEAELNTLLRALPLYDWMSVMVTPLKQHPNDPAPARSDRSRGDHSAS